ncbi:Cytochrome c-type biogenesis protein CcmH precursor [Budvicia aquatica]|uniref:Cytochrome c-type biogenesis protein CcmH n=1 Tax=Budvicia aquatica TaxID=82979 RepID=A0A484ZJY0_9GAMM|nr:c-type cytochrome biogenesis protein CcmI [Budvicia aquatica]VFS48790.1 Cytochrome c-type biogenesis protein CcmH precursor [Budvicia aquatica]
MIGFWLTIIVLLLISSALLIIPALRKPNGKDETSRDAINKAYYQQRLNELSDDEDQGVVTDRETLVAELQHNLLEDIPEGQSQSAQAPFNKMTLVPGVLLLVVVSLGLYLNTGGLAQVMQWQQVMKEMPELRQRADSGQLSSPEDIARFGLGLRTNLLSDPTNVRDWTMLGLAGLKLGDGGMALQSYEKAYALAPNDAYIQIIYAKLLTRSNDPNDIKDAAKILKKMIAADPNNVDALSALAMNAFGQGDFNQAIAAWEKVIALSPADAKGLDVIKSSLAYAKSQVAANGSKVSVVLTLSPEVQKQLPAQGSILIAVTDGKSPIPIAVKQLPLGVFPLELSLDDSNAMMPSRLLSELKQVKITATITSDDIADTRRLSGESEVHPFSGNETISLTVGHFKQ